MKFVIKSLPVLAIIFLFAPSIFAESAYLRVKPSLNQPEEIDSNGREISPFINMEMDVVSPKKGKTAIIRNMAVEIRDFDKISASINRVVVIIKESPGVDKIEVGRIVANGFNNGNGFFYLYPVHGDAISDLNKKVKMTTSVILNPDTADHLNEEIRITLTGIFASWVNGSSVPVKGFIPVESKTKIVRNDSSLGVINEEETSHGSLKYSVPESSGEGVKIKKIFIDGMKKDLRILVSIKNSDNKKYECKNNSHLTVCDFGGEGITIPPGSSVTITASEPNIFYQGFNTLDIFCEGEDSGRRIFVLPFSGGKG